MADEFDKNRDRAGRLIKSEFAKRRRVLVGEVNRILRKKQLEGIDHSTCEIKAVRAACNEEINTRATIVWNSVRRAYEAVRPPVTDMLAPYLKTVVNHHVEDIVRGASELMNQRLSAREMSAHLFDFERTESETKERMSVEIDLYVDSVLCKPAEPKRKEKPKQQKAGQGEKETNQKSSPPKEPSKEAKQAYQLYYGSGMKQEDIATKMSKILKRTISQGQVSRWVNEYRNWRKAVGIPVDDKKPNIITNTDILDMGARTDGRITGDPRHKAKFDPDE